MNVPPPKTTRSRDPRKSKASAAAPSPAEALLRAARVRYRALAQSRPDAIGRFDRELRHLEVDADVRSLTGRINPPWRGRTDREIGELPVALLDVWEAAARRVFSSGFPETLELVLPGAEGTRVFDCHIEPELDDDGACTAIVSVARDITDLTNRIAEGVRARKVAEALRDATVALTRSLDRTTVLATLLDRLRTVVSFDHASVLLVEDSALRLRAIFDGERVVSLGTEDSERLDPADHPIVAEILTSGTAVLIPNVNQHSDWRMSSTDELSWMGVPLFARGDVAGLVSLSKREAEYYRREHLELAEAMSSQASVAVENAILYEQMQVSSLRLRSLSRRLVDAQESERRHVARELHDEAGQALVSLRFGLRLLEREIDQGGSAAGRFSELVDRTDAVMESLHRLAADLRPASLDHLGLEAALRQLLRSAGAESELDVHLETTGLSRVRLEPEVETALYRVVQEAMTNVVRHAHATRVDVSVQVRGGRVLLVIEDDGVGLPRKQALGGDHLGLLGVRERAEALGGSLTIDSSPGHGTKLTVEVASGDSHPSS